MHNREKLILLSCVLVTFVLGSIHSFSVFLSPLEKTLELDRASVSLLYSMALVCLTISVLWGYRIYDKLPPGLMVLLACLAAGLGLLVASIAETWTTLFMAFSLIYGTANGVGYGFVLQLAGREVPQRKSFAMAIVTAAYAVGSVVFSLLLPVFIVNISVSAAFMCLAIVVICTGMLAAYMLHYTKAAYAINGSTETNTSDQSWSPIIIWWLAYGFSVFAGLMAIGHAAGIVQSLGGIYSVSVWGAVFTGIGSAAGGVFAGLRTHSTNVARYLTLLPIISATALFCLIWISLPIAATLLLTIIGFSYGALIAIYPYAISLRFGDQEGPKVYGRVFTAWGLAGLAGPWCAGWLFDTSQSYTPALGIAACIAICSSLVFHFFAQTTRRSMQS